MSKHHSIYGHVRFQQPISELKRIQVFKSSKARIPVERIGDSSFIHSVSTNQIRLLQRGGSWTNVVLPYIKLDLPHNLHSLGH